MLVRGAVLKSPSPSNKGFVTNVLVGLIGTVIGALLGGYITLINGLLPIHAQLAQIGTKVDALWAIYGPK